MIDWVALRLVSVNSRLTLSPGATGSSVNSLAISSRLSDTSNSALSDSPDVSVPSKTYSSLAAARPVIAAIDGGTEIPRLLAAAGAG